MRLRLDIAYDGAGFHGWAAQDGLRTVQGELETWVARLLRLESVALTCAGRTDAGVHARGQVAHVDLPDGPDPSQTAATLERRLRRALPDDVVVWRVGVAPEGFDARFSAIWRRYVYRLGEGSGDPLVRHLYVLVPHALDLDAMNAAASALLGLHDFAAFSKAREGATTIRRLQRLSVDRASTPMGDGVAITAQADAFCHSMVRSLAGALVEVGLGRREVTWPSSLLELGHRCGDVPVLPARGLVLEEVGYPGDDALAARAAQARAVRVLPDTSDRHPS